MPFVCYLFVSTSFEFLENSHKSLGGFEGPSGDV